MNALRVLREVSNLEPFALTSLEAELEVLHREDGSKWVDNDSPRDVGIAHALGRCGGNFALADEDWNFVPGAGPYRDLAKAEKARASAKMTVFAVDVEADEPTFTEAAPVPQVQIGEEADPFEPMTTEPPVKDRNDG